MNLSNRLGWIGVDIGTRCVKLAQVERTPAGIRLRHASVIQRADPWPEADTLAVAAPDPSEVEIRAALECDKFQGRAAACLLPMNVCELRGLNIPTGNHRERRAMIASELADDWADLQFPMEFDYWELEVDRGATRTDVFNVDVLAVSRPWVSQVARDCQHARLDCWAIDGAPLAMARAVNLAKPLRAGQRVLAVDWGYSNTTICVVGSEGPVYARRIHHCIFRQGLEAIRTALGVTLDRAQHIVDTHGVLDASEGGTGQHDIQAALTEALAPTTGELIAEIHRTLRFLEQQGSQLRMSSVWLMGGGASVRNIGAYLAKRIKLPVTIWSMPLTTSAADPDRATNGSLPLLGSAVALSALAWRAA